MSPAHNGYTQGSDNTHLVSTEAQQYLCDTGADEEDAQYQWPHPIDQAVVTWYVNVKYYRLETPKTNLQPR